MRCATRTLPRKSIETGRFSAAILRVSAGDYKQEITARAVKTRPCCCPPRLSTIARRRPGPAQHQPGNSSAAPPGKATQHQHQNLRKPKVSVGYWPPPHHAPTPAPPRGRSQAAPVGHGWLGRRHPHHRKRPSAQSAWCWFGQSALGQPDPRSAWLHVRQRYLRLAPTGHPTH